MFTDIEKEVIRTALAGNKERMGRVYDAMPVVNQIEALLGAASLEWETEWTVIALLYAARASDVAEDEREELRDEFTAMTDGLTILRDDLVGDHLRRRRMS